MKEKREPAFGSWRAECTIPRSEEGHAIKMRASAGQPRDCTTPLTPHRRAMAKGENVTKHMPTLSTAIRQDHRPE